MTNIFRDLLSHHAHHEHAQYLIQGETSPEGVVTWSIVAIGVEVVAGSVWLCPEPVRLPRGSNVRVIRPKRKPAIGLIPFLGDPANGHEGWRCPGEHTPPLPVGTLVTSDLLAAFDLEIPFPFDVDTREGVPFNVIVDGWNWTELPGFPFIFFASHDCEGPECTGCPIFFDDVPMEDKSEQIRTLVELARDGKESDFKDLARMTGVPEEEMRALWEGTVAKTKHRRTRRKAQP